MTSPCVGWLCLALAMLTVAPASAGDFEQLSTLDLLNKLSQYAPFHPDERIRLRSWEIRGDIREIEKALGKRGIEALPDMIAFLDTTKASGMGKAKIVIMLGELEDQRAVPLLLKIARTDTTGEIADAAVWAMCRIRGAPEMRGNSEQGIPNPELVPLLLDGLDHPSVHERLQAAACLRYDARGDEVAERLVRLIREEEPDSRMSKKVRHRALRTLIMILSHSGNMRPLWDLRWLLDDNHLRIEYWGYIHPGVVDASTAVPFLLEKAREDTIQKELDRSLIPEIGITALSYMGDAIPYFKNALKDATGEYQFWLVIGLHLIAKDGGPDGITGAFMPVVMEGLRSSYYLTRLHMVDIVRRKRYAPAIPLLQDLAENDPYFREFFSSSHGGQVTEYSVRMRASAALAELKEGEKR